MRDYIMSLVKGNMLSLVCKYYISKLSGIIFVLYCMSSFYLLIFDTSFIAERRLFDNQLVAASVCLSVIVIGFILLLLSLWQGFRYKISICAVCENVRIQKFSFSAALKYLFLRLTVNIIKAVKFSFFIMPFILMSFFMYLLITKGIAVSLLIVMSLCDILFLINGLYCYHIVRQNFTLIDYCFSEYYDKPITEMLNKSAKISDGKLKKLAHMRTKRSIYRLIGLLLPIFIIKENVSEYIFLTDKIIPYIAKKRYTEKSVVFYFGNRKAG